MRECISQDVDTLARRIYKRRKEGERSRSLTQTDQPVLISVVERDDGETKRKCEGKQTKRRGGRNRNKGEENEPADGPVSPRTIYRGLFPGFNRFTPCATSPCICPQTVNIERSSRICICITI